MKNLILFCIMNLEVIMKTLSLVVDMNGCPNRCKHCWLGHMPNYKMDETCDEFIINYFKPYFENITYYSWLREPDYCKNYKERWIKDNKISINLKPMRFELASFYMIVRDSNYVNFLKEVNVNTVQLTLFGLEDLTDKYVGRKGAYQEIIQATNLLIENNINVRWQAFINEENKEEIVQLLDVIEELKLKERCKDFKFFVHEGSCDGENSKLYSIRIQKDNIPQNLMPYYLGYDELLEEKECIELLNESNEKVNYEIPNHLVLNISNTYDVYFNFTHISEEWKIGNLKEIDSKELVRRIVEKDTFAYNHMNITYRELTNKYGDIISTKVFSLGDYKSYLFNQYLKEIYNQGE